MIYTSSSLALALLEMLVHVKQDQVPDYLWVTAQVLDHLIDPMELTEIPDDSAEYGTRWLETPGQRVAIKVPSVIIPEPNILLNPNHTDFPQIRWYSPTVLKLDPRLIQSPRSRIVLSARPDDPTPAP